MTRQEQCREILRGTEILFDRLERGESIEEMEIDLDIRAAGGALSESSHKVWRGWLEIIRRAREQGAGRKEVVTYLRAKAKELGQREQRDATGDHD
jgi:hypothetical protein